jgi:transaldolase / glucose-6-phosphate isomerase
MERPARGAPHERSIAQMAADLIRQVTGGTESPEHPEPDDRIPLEDPGELPSLLSRGDRGRGAPAAATAPAAGSSGSGRDPLEIDGAREAVEALEAQEFADRLWMKDGTLWPGDAAAIRNRLGWLTSPTIMREHTADLQGFADEIRRLQFRHVVLLGMGGSSLCAETLGLTFGSKMGFPDLLVLDSTDPAAVRHVLDRVTPGRTLFLVATKSGTTAETLAFYAFFRSQVEAAGVPKPGQSFVAITDPGSPLEKLAGEAGFRRTFLNPATIGGRYSALSFFGLLPAALIGVDVKGLLERAQEMVEACGSEIPPRDNPALRLGAALAVLAERGRDKATFVFSDRIASFGAWVEQLIAESLGKSGKGVLPVDGEPLGAPAVYGADRVFVAMLLQGDASHDAALGRLAEAGHPVIRLRLRDPLDLGAEFFRWELATAVAGAVLGVNPFDEPDVTRAKDNTAALLAAWRKSRTLPEWPEAGAEEGLRLLAPAGPPAGSFAEALGAHLRQARPGDYVGIQAYLAPRADTWKRLQGLRALLRDRLGVATTVAYGPRYLHSTGQLHKGGPPTGLFLQLTADDREDLAIPGASYGFSTLKAAQALGDLRALQDDGRRVVRVHLAGKSAAALERLIERSRAATRKS